MGTSMCAFRRFASAGAALANASVLFVSTAGLLASMSHITCAATPTQTQNYPARPTRLIIPYPPGGPRDIQARLLGPRLSEVWGQSLVIDNRAGASGIIGTALAAKAQPDGYTLVMISSGFATAPSLYAKVPFDPLRDFTAVAPLTSGPGLLIVNDALPVRSVKELIAYAHAHPGQLNYGSAGNGVPSHLSVELFKMMTGTSLTHVPYKGMAPAINDLLGGQIQVSLPTIPAALPHVQAGRVRALGVSGVKRSPAAPQVPAIAEAGIPGYVSTNWYGIVAPAGTPSAIVSKLNGEITRTLTLPEVRTKLLAVGMEVQTGSPTAFEAFLAAEVAKWAKVVKATGVRLD
ncbi:MAG: tripartite tricarboxylate transporter substrate binding protein [Betaproteobacteria bacterium]|nr:tripartite tricarboxylate transporter substrate binding protein [Betaproteobacteria bacterium]